MKLEFIDCTYLDDSLAIIGGLRVDDDFQFHTFCFHASFKCCGRNVRLN